MVSHAYFPVFLNVSVCCLKERQRGNRLCGYKTEEEAKLIKHEMLSKVSSEYSRKKNLFLLSSVS